jgi:hypothetical protein
MKREIILLLSLGLSPLHQLDGFTVALRLTNVRRIVY